jgi:hypothetical protein
VKLILINCDNSFHLLNYRVQKDDTTIDTVKVDDPKKAKLISVKEDHDKVKTEKDRQRTQTILVPNVQLSKLQLSPQEKLLSTPNGQKSTKLLGRICFEYVHLSKSTHLSNTDTSLTFILHFLLRRSPTRFKTSLPSWSRCSCGTTNHSKTRHSSN